MRPTNQTPEHPLRIIHTLGKYGRSKPLKYNETLLDRASAWLRDEAFSRVGNSPLDALDLLLETEGYDQVFDDNKIVFTPYGIDATVVAPLRARVVDLAVEEFLSDDLGRAARACRTLATAVKYPIGSFGRTISDEEREQWTGEFLETIKKLGKAVASRPDPVLAVAVRTALYWHAWYSRTNTRREARKVLTALPKDTWHALAFALHDGWGELGRDRADYSQAELQRRGRFEYIAGQLQTLDGYPDSIVTQIGDFIVLQRRHLDQNSNPRPFIYAAATYDVNLGIAAVESAISDPASPLIEVSSTALSAIAIHQGQTCSDLAMRMIETGRIELVRSVGESLGWSRGGREQLVPNEIEILIQLAGNSDELVRKMAAGAAHRIASFSPQDALKIIEELHASDSVSVAAELVAIFGTHGSIEWAPLPAEVKDRILQVLVTAPRLDEYEIMDFLNKVGSSNLPDLLDFFLARIEKHSNVLPLDAEPVPTSPHQQLEVRSNPDFQDVLDNLLDWLESGQRTQSERRAGSNLIVLLSGSVDAQIVGTLTERVRSARSIEHIEIACFVFETVQNLAFDFPEYVSSALKSAARFGNEGVDLVRGPILMATSVRSGFRSVGEPPLEDVRQRIAASEIALSYPADSLERELYNAVAERLDDWIQWLMRTDRRSDETGRW